MGIERRRMAIGILAALVSCLSTASGQVLRELGTFDGWRVVDADEEACAMITPPAFETAMNPVLVRLERGGRARLLTGTRLSAPPDLDTIDFSRVEKIDVRYAFRDRSGAVSEPRSAVATAGFESPDGQAVSLGVYFEADATMLEALARSDRFAVEIAGHWGYFNFGNPARALAETRRCVARKVQ